MRYFAVILIAFATLVSCGGVRKKSTSVPSAEPAFYTYEIVAEYPHSRTSYTQGLQFVENRLWEGTGEYGHSRILRTELVSGKILQSQANPSEEFGEGITVLGDKIYQLTWLNGKMHIYDSRTLEPLATHTYKGEGWGLTNDGTKLYMSDGTHTIRVIDPATLKEERRYPARRISLLPKRVGVDRGQDLGKCLYHQLYRYHQPREWYCRGCYRSLGHTPCK